MNNILHELEHHIPFTVFSAVAGLIIIALLTVVMTAILPLHEELEGLEEHSAENETAADEHTEHEEHHHHGVGMLGESFYELFHVFHPFHILFSAAATTAMFWRYEKKLSKAIGVGLIGSLAICAASDIYLPYVGGSLIGVDMGLHVCLIEHPHTVIPFAFIGIFIGLISCEVFHGRKSTIFSHSGHVFISTMASILYLVGFGYSNWMENLLIVFIIVVLAVFIPCCTSDIIFPLLFVSKKQRRPKQKVCDLAKDSDSSDIDDS